MSHEEFIVDVHELTGAPEPEIRALVELNWPTLHTFTPTQALLAAARIERARGGAPCKSLPSLLA